jgi:hypothetical protein
MSSSSLRTTLDLAPAHAGAQGFAVSESVHGKALLQHPGYDLRLPCVWYSSSLCDCIGAFADKLWISAHYTNVRN